MSLRELNEVQFVAIPLSIKSIKSFRQPETHYLYQKKIIPLRFHLNYYRLIYTLFNLKNGDENDHSS
ncbi:MAG: hypothetical protein IKH45_05850 [Neisseriaceae bacterium]|nr:hypothetical protein [Neisseriaceae bacterium]